MGKLIRVAIDGPSGAGKSTIAKKVAKALDLDYIDMHAATTRDVSVLTYAAGVAKPVRVTA